MHTVYFTACAFKKHCWLPKKKPLQESVLNTLYRKFETYIPRNETSRPHIHKCENWKRGRAKSKICFIYIRCVPTLSFSMSISIVAKMM
jgi:hypothetical protein